MKMKHLDLFSGYGGFTIPAQKYRMKTIGFSEIDKYACGVLAYNFKNIKNYGDITKLRGEDLPTVDIITGGSPCQDLSVAGKGAGLNAERSGLFFHFIRLIKEIQPTYFVWENVKGAFSSQRGWDFGRVQIEMEQAGYDVWWQTLNAKDFGVPQNRERIFAIGIRKGSGREILFEQRNSGQNLRFIGGTKHRKKWLKDGKGNSRNFSQGDRVYDPSGVASSQNANGGGLGAKTGLYAIAIPNSKGNVHALDSNYWKGSNNPNKSRRSQIVVHNLQPRSATRPSLLKNPKAGGSGYLSKQDGTTHTVDTGNTQGVETKEMEATRVTPMRWSRNEKGKEARRKAKGTLGKDYTPFSGGHRELVESKDDISGCITNALNKDSLLKQETRIRRLTPVECERLMGLEDGWTAKGIMDGKEVDISDTQRYRMCGNGVVTNCVDYVYSLIIEPS